MAAVGNGFSYPLCLLILVVIQAAHRQTSLGQFFTPDE